MRNKLTKFLTSECPPKGMRQFTKTWKHAACMLLAFILGIGQMWGAYYTPTADEVVIIKEKMSDATNGYGTSTHGAFSFAAEITSSNKQMGSASLPIPDGSGNATYSTYKLKGNGGVKNMTLTIAGCSKLIIYNKSHSSRYVMAEITPEGESMSTQNGTASTTSTEITLDGSKSYSIWVYGYDGSSHQDIEVYAFKLIKDNSGADPVAVTGITIAPSPANVKVGKTRTLSATVTPNNATDKAVTWAVTSGGTYASVVEATGVVTGLAVGTATITATAHDGSGVTQTVTVNVEECPTSGTIYKFQLKTGLTNGNLVSSDSECPKDIIATTDNYLSSLVGGSLTIAARNKANRVNISNGNAIGFANGEEAFLKMDLDCSIQAGDILKYDITSNDMILMAGSETEATNRMTLSRNVTQVEVDSKLVGADALYMKRSSSSPRISYFEVFRPVYHAITLEYADGATADGNINALDGEAATKPADPTWAHHRFDGWYNGATPYDWTANVTGDLTLTAHWTQLYTISFNNGGGSGDAPAAIADKAQGETFTVPANTYTAPDGKVFEKWNDGTNDYDPDDTYTVGTNNVTLTAVWRTPSTMYAITKGAHENGDFTIAPASQEAGEIVTLEATPDDGYLFSAWEVVKTEDASATGITVDANGQFTMPGYAVTVNATFVADTRAKVLYVTNNNETTTKASDKLYEALKDDYRVTIVGPASTETVTNYALVVLHESVGGSNYNATAVAAAKGGAVPVLNTKSYFYNDGRWNWGTPNAGKTIKGATLNSAYCNIANHPLFSGVAMTDGFFEITDDAAAKCMQPIGSFVAGKEGYTLATTPNNDSGEGCAIHELTPEQRGVASGKYLMISVLGDKLSALNANGQKLFQNAAAYLIDGSASWTPVLVPTTPEIAGTTAYSAGETIELTASATGESAATTYTWYKGATLEAAKGAGAIQAAKTIAENGNVYSKADGVVGDAGTYWCVISNGTDCEANASVEITVSDASYNASFVSAHGTAPVSTSGVSYTLPELIESGYVHQGWTANIDVTVDEAVVTAGTTIANGKTAIFGADVTFTAVWKQIFAVTFNLNGQSGSIAPQDIIDGEKATKPADPVVIGQEFGGWFTDEECTAGNEFDFNTPITAATPLYAKWTAFDGCTLLVPATSGETIAANDVVDLQGGSFGGEIKALTANLSYKANGLQFGNSSDTKAQVTLSNDMKAGTVITAVIYNANNDKARGLQLLNSENASKATWTKTVVGTHEETYTVVEGDGLAGTNVFQLKRSNDAFLQSIKVTNCGDAIVYHNVTSAVDPADKGTVTLGASSVREGKTTTAEYSAIDPLYEFVNWTVSGAGASVADATANPATITVGTEDAVVTLNLRLIPVKFTVEYYDGATLMGSEQVAVNENPTASEIVTAKRHYTFLGWSDTDGGDVVALNTITRTEAGTVKLYAKYEAVVCPTSGTIFSMEFDETKKPGETVTIAKDASIDLAEYATISGGNAMIINGETSGKDAISTDGEFLLKATKEVMKIELNCVLQEGDIIRVPDNSAKLVISTSNSKTGTYQAFADKNTHEFAVTAAWAGVDDIYVLYDGSSLKFTKVYVIRPAKYDVSFNMMGHGSAIADLEDVVDGSKITAPSPAPTDVDYSFAGWYKENTLENEWDFDVDVVDDNITLYAKWLDKSDATLKSLKYGETEITLEAGVYTYNVSLPAFTSAVPALTAETSSPNATKVITNGTFDGEGNATSTVTVTPEVGADQIYTVNFAKGVEILLQDVTGSTTWNFANAVTETVNITGTPHVLANYGGVTNDATFESNKLEASGEKFTAGTKANLRANYIHFHTTVQGMLTISYSNTGGSNPARFIYVNGVKYDEEGSANTTAKGADRKVFVPAGDVELVMKDGEGASKNVQIYQIIFKAPDYVRTEMLGNGVYGTICVDHNVPEGGVRGVTVYEIAGREPQYGKIAFDEVTEMEAGVPYVFIAHGNEMALYYGETKVDNPVNGNGMYGTFIAQTLTDLDGIYYFAKSALWSCVDLTSLNLPANRAYVKLSEIDYLSDPNPAPGRKRILLGVNGQNAATDLGNVQGDEVQSTKVLINGQLFILRGEKMYDATGRMVK